MSADNKEQVGWIGVDLDGTLAHYDGWKGPEHIGEPVPEMVRKVKAWLAEGREVRVFTARVHPNVFADVVIRDEDRGAPGGPLDVAFHIQKWCIKHLGQLLWITCQKDYGMVELYDDRCVYVFPNSGITHREHQGMLQASFVEVAAALGVEVKHGANFKEVADYCAFRARVCSLSADRYEAALALADAALDALSYDKPADTLRGIQTLNRAVALLRELAGKKDGKR